MQDIRWMVLAAALAALTGVGAWILIPIGPVPITLQVLFVLLAGLLLPFKYAMLAMVLYILMGIIGLPIFAGGTSGIGVVIGPTGGYFVGFVVAVGLISLIAKRAREQASGYSRAALWLRAFVACVAGSVVIFALGGIWGKFSTGLDWMVILSGWILPFIPGNIAKIIVATFISGEVWQRGLLKGRFE